MLKRFFLILLVLFCTLSVFAVDIKIASNDSVTGFDISSDEYSVTYSVSNTTYAVRTMGYRIERLADGIWRMDDGQNLIVVAENADSILFDSVVTGLKNTGLDPVLLLAQNSSVSESFIETIGFKNIGVTAITPALQSLMAKGEVTVYPLRNSNIVTVEGKDVSFNTKTVTADEEIPVVEAEKTQRVLVTCPHCGEPFYATI